MAALQKQDYVQGILAGNTIVLSQAITLLESTKTVHNDLARAILEELLPHTGKAKRIGVTGVPGVGKSTLIERLGLGFLSNENNKLAVLAIDPSSQLTKGSILGDKTRMEALSSHKRAYIRPTAAGSALGGVSRKTHESMLLCEAAGFNYIVVETVGVGQSEIAVHAMVDCFLLLHLPGTGDELQGIKRGIMEMADIIAINKSYENGALKPAAKKARQEINNALHYYPQKELSWITKIQHVDALHNEGMDKLRQLIDDFFNHQQLKAFFTQRRKKQHSYWLKETINQYLLNSFYNNDALKAHLEKMKAAILNDEITAYKAADSLFEMYKKNV